jgi:hypothetical protein
MSVAGIFLLLAFLVGAAAIIAWPLLQNQGETKPRGGALSGVAQLQAEHEAILIAVRDLDFDYQTGKLTQEDYTAQRESLIQRGVEILKLIDERQNDLIEEAVRAHRPEHKVAKS